MARRLCILALVPTCLWLGYRTIFIDGRSGVYALPVLFGALMLLLLVLLVIEFGEQAKAALYRSESEVRNAAKRKSLGRARGSNTPGGDRESGRNSTA